MADSHLSYQNSEQFLKLSKVIESTRKDVEDVFGILKKRFMYLKHWNTVRRQYIIDNAFVTWCMLHNLQLRHDGFLDTSYEPPAESALNGYQRSLGTCGDSMWRRNWDQFQENYNIEVGKNKTREKQWAERMKTLLLHFEVHMKLKNEEDRKSAAE